MKYLKLYENFDNKLDEMVLYLKDILSDIEDEGFHVDIESRKSIVHIYIYKPLKIENDPFKFSEIKEAYDRIIIFTHDYGWVPFYQVFPRFRLATETEIDKTIIPNENEKIYYAELIFKSNVETNEGLFDFFKDSEDDKIAMSYINRLKKVKGISPYVIKEDVINHDGFDIIGYEVTFDDTPIRSTSIISNRSRGFDKESQEYLKEQGAVRRNDIEFYALSVNCEGDREMVYAKAYILKELNDLCKKVYDNDKNTRRIKKITGNINPAADLNESTKVFENREHELQRAIARGIIDPNDSDKVKDILADLIDSGYIIDIVANATNFTVRITKVDEEDYEDPNDYLEDCEFTYDNVKPDIDELISQFSDKYPKYTIYLSPSGYFDEYGDRDFKSMDEFVDKYSLDEISQVQINFHKN